MSTNPTDLYIVSTPEFIKEDRYTLWYISGEIDIIQHIKDTMKDHGINKYPCVLRKFTNINKEETMKALGCDMMREGSFIWVRMYLDKLITVIKSIDKPDMKTQIIRDYHKLCNDVSTYYREAIIGELHHIITNTITSDFLCNKLLDNKQEINDAFWKIVPELLVELHGTHDIDCRKYAFKMMTILQ